MKLKIKYMKLKNGKRKLNERIYNIKQIGDSIYTGKINLGEAEMDQAIY